MRSNTGRFFSSQPSILLLTHLFTQQLCSIPVHVYRLDIAPYFLIHFPNTSCIIDSERFLAKLLILAKKACHSFFVKFKTTNHGFQKKSYLATGRSVRSFDELGRLGELRADA